MAYFAQLPNRGLITVSGSDRVAFLQGLVSNDVEKASDDKAVWTALLTPQGKYRHDFFVITEGNQFLLDCEGGDRLMDLGRSLRRYVLRADAQLGIDQDRVCFAVWDSNIANTLESLDLSAIEGSAIRVFTDPRLTEMGYRIIGPAAPIRQFLGDAGLEETDATAWDEHRIPLGVPDGARDLAVDKALLLENGFEELHGVDWQKGCYMGQELTARTKYRGLVKKRLIPVRLEGEEPTHGSQITVDGRDAGTLYSVSGGVGLALLRLERLENSDVPLLAGECRVTPMRPDWMSLPGEGAA